MKETVFQNGTGYYFEPGDADGYANTISLLNSDRKLLNNLAERGIEKANELFDPYHNAKNIERLISLTYYGKRKNKKAFKAYGSRLDNPLIGNTAVTAVRRLRSSSSNK